VLVSGSALIPPDYALSGDPADLERGLNALASHALHFPGFDADFELDKMAGDGAYDSEYWKITSPLEVADRIRVPTFIVGGHHDIFQRGEPLLYERLKNRVPTRLLVGPWTHTAVGEGLPADGVPAIDQIALRWLDNYLKGIDTDVDAIPRVTQYALGDERYETQSDWPDPRLAPSRLFLRAGGALAPAAPATPEAPETFLQNPVSGVCTQSTSQWSAGLLAPVPCTRDNRLDETNGATYTTPPQAQDLRLSGPLVADLWVTTTAADAVVSVRATDVAPDGTSTELTAGWLAASFRALDTTRSRYVKGELLQPWHPFTRASVLGVTAGTPTQLSVEIFPTNAVIKAGHSLRIAVGPNDFPHAVPPLLQLAGTLGGVVQVLHDPQHPSSVTLPTLGSCAKPCRPLPVANLVRG
jgi:putative CocE/NonD family hydrolase